LSHLRRIDLTVSRFFSLFQVIQSSRGRVSAAKLIDRTFRQKTDAQPEVPPYGAPAQGKSVPQGERQVSGGQEDTDWAALLLRVRNAQDKAAFAALFRHFAPRVKGFLMRSGADAAQAEEWAQDVMATLWQKAHQFDPSRASVATWVFTIARNRRIDALRRARRPEPEDLPWGQDDEPDQADIYLAQEEVDRLGAAIAQLPDKQRTLIERAYYGDVSHAELAAETGLPLGTIKSRIRLALERLRYHLGERSRH
jgi:RNA polymerase sigma factor (sigma-70 family)